MWTMPRLRFTHIEWCPLRGLLVLAVSTTLIATTAVAQGSLGGFHPSPTSSHFSNSGRPPRWSEGQAQPGPVVWQSARTAAASVPGLNSCGGVQSQMPLGGDIGSNKASSAGISSTASSSLGEPEHLQLLRLSIELTQQARFNEAKAALGAAAHLVGGSSDVLAQAHVLRWRMGLRQVSAAEAEAWLGRSHGAAGASGLAAVGSPTLGESSEPDWAEVPSSAPRDHTLTPSVPSARPSVLVLAFSVIFVVGVLLLFRCLWSTQSISEAPTESKAVDTIPAPPSILAAQDEAVEMQAARQEAEAEEPAEGNTAADPALDVGTDDDFLAGLEGLDEGQQLSGVGGWRQQTAATDGDSACSGDGSSSASEDACGNAMSPAPPAGETDPDSKDQQGKKSRKEDAAGRGDCERREASLEEPTALDEQEEPSQQGVCDHTCPTVDEEVPGRRWRRTDADSDVAVGAVNDMFLEDEDWEDAAEKPLVADVDEKVPEKECPKGEAEDLGKQQRRVRWGYERRAEWVEDEVLEDVDEDDLEDEEEEEEVEAEADQVLGDEEVHRDEAPVHIQDSNSWEIEDQAEEAGLDGYADDEWEDVSQNKALLGNEMELSPAPLADGGAVDRLTTDEATRCPSAQAAAIPAHTVHIASEVEAKETQGCENQPRTLWLSHLIPNNSEDKSHGAEQGGEHMPDNGMLAQDPDCLVGADAEIDGEDVDVQEDMEDLQDENETWQEDGVEEQEGPEVEDMTMLETQAAAEIQSANQDGEYDEWTDPDDPKSQSHITAEDLNLLKSSSAQVGKHIIDDGDWAWGCEAEVAEEEGPDFDGEEAREAALAIAAAWKPQKACWTEGAPIAQLSVPSSSSLPHGMGSFDAQKQKTLAHMANQRSLKNPESGTAAGLQLTRVPPPNSSFEEELLEDEEEAEEEQEEEESGNYVYFAAPSKTGRTWYPAKPTSGKRAAIPDATARAQGNSAPVEEGFIPVRPTRFRPTGCFVRLRGGQESWLPVEHMEPKTAATTTAIRERMRAIEQLFVREVDKETVSMLSEADAKRRAGELDARHRLIEEGIAVLRGNYDPRKWVSGSISAVQGNGVYVSVVEGKDAFVPMAELPDKAISSSTDAEDDRPKPNLQPGQAVQFRVIRHSWQTDSFVASMLSYEESVAKRKGSGVDGPLSAPPAVAYMAKPGENAPADRSSVEQVASPDLSKTAKRLADKGFAVLDTSTASQLNEWLQQSTAESKAAKNKSKAGLQKNEKTFIVNIMRGMNGKVIGQLDLPRSASDKDVKDGAIEMVMKAGELKAGQDHKGVTVAKNIITVKL